MFTASVLTVSDKGFSGERRDTAGPLASSILEQAEYAVAPVEIVPDEQDLIEAALIRMSDQLQSNLIITTGGTGFSLRDVTPEATAAVCGRLAPGIPEAMRAASMAVTDRAMLSRAVGGMIDQTIVLLMPGSTAAVRLAMEKLVLPEIGHLVEHARK